MKAMSKFSCLLIVSLNLSAASGQDDTLPPLNSVVITTQLSHGWELEIKTDKDATTSTVRYSSGALLSSVRATLSVKDCIRMSEALQEAANAVENNSEFENDRVGDVTISTGTGKVSVLRKDGNYVEEERAVVKLGGGESGLFTSPLQVDLIPEEAAKLATTFKAVPKIHSRLKSAIEFDKIWAEK